MNGLFRQGLVVGKFSPLHRGHELLIRTALERCKQVAIISYASPELSGCGAELREKWLRALFPQVQRLVVTTERLAKLLPGRSISVPDDDEPDTVHRQFVGFLCRELLGITADAVFTSENYGDGFAAELTDNFRNYNPNAAQVAHVLVDRERRSIPISGTMVRADVHGWREMLSPLVYASFVKRICILGGESSGKSTLACALAEHFRSVHVAEYGRELWEERDGKLLFEDMLAIGREQVAREEQALLSARKYLFCDTSPLTTLFYSRFMFGRCDPALEVLADRPYDLILLCAPDFAFVQDGTRQSPKFRERQHRWYLEELERRRLPWILVTGDVAERVARTAAVLTQNESERDRKVLRDSSWQAA